jgi:MFS transporter, DHA1 family, tetracycline resistance protein
MSSRRAALAFVFVVVAMDMLALGLTLPVLPRLIESFEGGDTSSAAQTFGIFGTAWALMQFIFMPVMGALSDRYGRRRVILISCFGLGLDYFMMALAPNLGWLFAGRIISGICSASVTTAFAYIADVTPPEKRAGAFGIMGAAFGLGFVLGPATGGILGQVDPRLPFWVAGALALVNAAYGFFVLPESLPPEKRAPFKWSRANPVGSLVLLRSHPELFGLSVSNFLVQLAYVVLPSTTVLYMSYRYGWNELTIGLALAGVGAAAVVVQGGLVRPVVKRVGERTALAIGLIFGAAGFTIYGLAPTGFIFALGIPVMAMWGFAGPSIQALMTRHVSASEQGQLQGATASIAAIASLIGPGVFTQLFAWSIRPGSGVHAPGAPYFLAAAFVLCGLALAWHVTSPARATSRPPPSR